MEMMFAIEKKLRFRKPITTQTTISIYTTGKSKENFLKPFQNRFLFPNVELLLNFVSI